MKTPASLYSDFIARLSRLASLSETSSLLFWDETVNMPSGGAESRARQKADLAGIIHREATDPLLGECLKNLLGSEELDPDQKLIVERALEDYEKETRLPTSFVERKTALQSKGYHTWVKARKEGDFEAFLPVLRELIHTAREEADLQGWSEDTYAYWMDRFDRGLKPEKVAGWFDTIRGPLTDLLCEIRESGVQTKADQLKNFDTGRQASLINEVCQRLGFDFNHGRFDVSIHPFCSGSGQDIRMTTRFDKDNPLDSLTSIIHETGHALYEQGLPVEPRGSCLTQAAGMAVHESQSRTWENQVARSPEFWRWFDPIYRKTFSEELNGLSPEELLLAVNQVVAQPIRVDADEITYNLHIILRFEMEKALFSGNLDPVDLPGAWDDLSQELLGIRPETVSKGVLQDVHWSEMLFGYFPSYAVGNLVAAQFWQKALQDLPNLTDDFSKGEFSRLLTWQRENIHRHGGRWNTVELVREVTGSELDPRNLLDYLNQRYRSLYGL